MGLGCLRANKTVLETSLGTKPRVRSGPQVLVGLPRRQAMSQFNPHFCPQIEILCFKFGKIQRDTVEGGEIFKGIEKSASLRGISYYD
jgi:hypothetical protein